MILLAVVLLTITAAGGAGCYWRWRKSPGPSPAFFQNVLEAATEPIMVIDENEQILYANAAAAALFGYPAAILSQKTAADLLFLLDGQELLPRLRRFMLAGDRHAWPQHDLKGKAQDGSEFPVRLRINEVAYRESSAFVLTLRDILGEHLVELELRRHAEQLRQVKNSLQSQNKNLESIVTERTAELACEKESAERANRSKTDFVNIVSHELRSPLHGILSYAELGVDRAATLDRGKLHDYFATILRCGNALLVLVNDLLDLSKIESGTLVLNVMKTDLVELVTRVVSETEALRTQRDVSVLINCKCEHISIEADPEKLGQVIRNLLSNALKFSPDGSQINITMVQSELAVMLAVRDQGPGIPQQDIPHVFDKFYQASNGQQKCGTGLGLAICQQIIELHRGEISVRNAEQGGAEFSFMLCSEVNSGLVGPSQPLVACPG